MRTVSSTMSSFITTRPSCYAALLPYGAAAIRGRHARPGCVGQGRAGGRRGAVQAEAGRRADWGGVHGSAAGIAAGAGGGRGTGGGWAVGRGVGGGPASG